MGCCSSSALEKVNISLDEGIYVKTPERTASRRSLASRISSGSSGVFSNYTSPSRKSISSSRSNGSKLNISPSLKPKGINFNEEPKVESPKLSACDDFVDVRVLDLDKSFGYFSDTNNTDSSLRHLPNCEPFNDLEMEMYMVTHADFMMPKTSSPIFNKREIGYAMPSLIEASPASQSYQKWRNYLQRTPTYLSQNITNIPEAIAGLFCPQDFPAFTELDDMERPAKRYKVDNGEEIIFENFKEIVSTDL
ncbi:uncharacterized protein LOC119666994 [Teleopsis dalmanni]|uniref:uncharacterized protein LOC119666994 n=1 Tax=Teleopsis dalmanni TaxID=139649 RepID=UPI0018CF5D9E|nr:uncharacterized protein LOC119666994 [Teleopsis dalmanni]